MAMDPSEALVQLTLDERPPGSQSHDSHPPLFLGFDDPGVAHNGSSNSSGTQAHLVPTQYANGGVAGGIAAGSNHHSSPNRPTSIHDSSSASLPPSGQAFLGSQPIHTSASSGMGGSGSRSSAFALGSGSGSHFVSLNSPEAQSRNVYAASLPGSFTDENLRDLFLPYGQIVSCKMFNNDGRPSSHGRAYGFVMFAEEASVQKAIDALVGAVVGNQRIQVRRAKPGRSQPSSANASPQASGSNVGIALATVGGLSPVTTHQPMFVQVAQPPPAPPQQAYTPYMLPSGQTVMLPPAPPGQQFVLMPGAQQQAGQMVVALQPIPQMQQPILFQMAPPNR